MDGGVLAGRFRDRETYCVAVMEETSAVDVLGQHFGPLAKLTLRRKLKWDLVKRCDLPGKSSHPT